MSVKPQTGWTANANERTGIDLSKILNSKAKTADRFQSAVLNFVGLKTFADHEF
jgi:hypothetical protein